MSAPNNTVPTGKAASIWSFDSGYGSNTLEDDESVQVRNCAVEEILRTTIDTLQQGAEQSSSTVEQGNDQPIGLGISNFWSGSFEELLRSPKPEPPIDSITTRLNVFTVNATSNFVRPSALHIFEPEHKSNRLAIPQDSRSKQVSNGHTKTRCSACDLAHVIDPSSSACQSCTPDLSFLSPSPGQESTIRRSCARRTAKLPPYALQRLRSWLKANREHPYPNADTKHTLAQECGITEKQVTTWFTNTRARKLAQDRSIASSEDEGAYESDYSNMMNTPMYTSPAVGYDTAPTCHPDPSTPGMVGKQPAQLSLQTSRRGKKKDYRRVNTISPVEEAPMPRTPATASPNPEGNGEGYGQETWQCTFCSQHLVPKSWRRHEETQHRAKYLWTCLATGPRLEVASRNGTTSICAFCQMKNPNDDHFDRYHRITECIKKKEEDRTFGRPDHLRQHIKNFHKASLLDQIRDKWRRDGPGRNVNEGWTCGFCKAELQTWDIRETHIANHFKDGLTMASWQQELQQPTPPVAQNDRRRQSQDIHTTMLSRLQRRFSNRQPEYFAYPPAQFSNTFDPLPSSSRCANIAPAPVLPEIADMGFGGYMPGFMGNYDMSGAQFGATYTMNDNAYGVYQGDEGLQMDFDALASADAGVYGNLSGYSGV
jgi:hypothetical protein